MAQTPIKRSKSSVRPSSSSLNLDQILKCINPLNKPSIELEDMKRVLSRLPESSRITVQKIFHSYIFNTKSFILETTEFCRLYNTLINSQNKVYEESHFRQADSFRDISRRELNKETSFLVENRSSSPGKKAKNVTYAQIYKEKKEPPRRKQPEKRFTCPVKDTSDSSPLQKSIESFNTNRSFKDCYSNIQELIDIRKAHLQQTSLNR